MRHVKRKGFTLLELLIVMFIIGVLTAVVAVNFRRGDRSQDLRQVSTEFIQSIRLAQAYATSGNSINYCNASAPSHAYEACEDDMYCAAAGTCIDSVPPGGYGIYIDNAFSYRLFANTNTVSYYFDSTEPVITQKDVLDTGVGVIQYQVGGTVYTPDTIPLSIVFTPPTGEISIFTDITEVTEPSLILLIKSNYIEDVCRTIRINRISNQISEEQSGCNLP